MFIMIYLQKYMNTIAAIKAGKIVFLLREIICDDNIYLYTLVSSQSPLA